MQFSQRRSTLLVALVTAVALLGSCRTMYYQTMEAFGQHKRDLLVDRVSDARDDQQEAKEQFRTALERFSELVDIGDSELRDVYEQLTTELDRSESKARRVRDQVQSIETVAKDLFSEWEAELSQYTNAELRAGSRQALEETRDRYGQLHAAMKRVEQKMEPVLTLFRDQVLFLKHNLNAQAIASLEGTVHRMELDTTRLIEEMEAAIAEADSFIRTMTSRSGA